MSTTTLFEILQILADYSKTHFKKKYKVKSKEINHELSLHPLALLLDECIGPRSWYFKINQTNFCQKPPMVTMSSCLYIMGDDMELRINDRIVKHSRQNKLLKTYQNAAVKLLEKSITKAIWEIHEKENYNWIDQEHL